MAENEHTLYEGLFLMSQEGGRETAKAREVVEQMLHRAEAEVLTVHKWDDRRLAYPIKGQKRGLFMLALFRVAGVRIANIERDCNLAEDVSRVLITRGDHLGEMEIEAITGQAEQAAAEEALQDSGEGADESSDTSASVSEAGVENQGEAGEQTGAEEPQPEEQTV